MVKAWKYRTVALLEAGWDYDTLSDILSDEAHPDIKRNEPV
jgi:hypothetical protein